MDALSSGDATAKAAVGFQMHCSGGAANAEVAFIFDIMSRKR